MNTLCFASNLTSAEWAAWAQAIGSILAILSAVGIAVYVAHKQHKNALALHIAEQRYARSETTKTLLVLAQNCTKAVDVVIGQVDDRTAVYEISEGRAPCYIEEIVRLDSAIMGIPVHNIPSSLVTPTMALSATVRQFREKVETVLRVHRTMDSSDFEVFFRIIGEMRDSLKGTCEDITKISEGD